jgi:methionyl-tRNA formyltransferase
LVIVVADNQVEIARALNANKAGIYLGEQTQVVAENIVNALQSLMNDQARREAMSKRGRELVDGAGVNRVARVLSGKFLRITVVSDSDSWLNNYLPDFVEMLNHDGNEVHWVHKTSEIGWGDLCFMLSFGQVVPPDILARHKHNLVVHESDLPHGRGWSPLTWQILEGKNDITVTLLEAAEELDSGSIYGQRNINFTGSELVDELRVVQAHVTFELCKTFVKEYPESIKKGRLQAGDATYYRRRRPMDSKLDPSKSLLEQFNLLRVVDNERYPAFFEHAGERYVVKVEKQK